MKPLFAGLVRTLSPGVAVIAIIGAITAIIVACQPVAPTDGLQVWVFDSNQAKMYEALAPEWNRKHPDLPLRVSFIVIPALQSRMLSAFYSGTPVADVIEMERMMVAPAFAGPIEDIGFVDLTERLKSEGLMEKINPASFSPWTTRGHIFGLPHDVAPVMLAYRADLVEAAHIDVSQIETWDDYFRVMQPLRQDLDGDGFLDRYPLALSLSYPFFSEIFLLQGGGGYFDTEGQPTLNSEANTRMIAQLATWYAGPKRVIGDLNLFSGAGLHQIAAGDAVAIPAPDWYLGTLVTSLPQVAGKFKIMPLPAWEKGGRRVSANGGTMLGLTKASRHPKEAWELMKYLYFSPVLAEQLFERTHIVTPMKPNWSLSCYDRPDPYYSNQPVGRLYLNQAPSVPLRPASPYIQTAVMMMTSALTQIMQVVDQKHATEPAQVLPETRRILDEAQRSMERQMEHNAFLSRPDK